MITAKDVEFHTPANADYRHAETNWFCVYIPKEKLMAIVYTVARRAVGVQSCDISLYGALVATGNRWALCGGYVFAAILMLTSNEKAAMRPRGRFSNCTLRTIGSVGLFTTMLGIVVVFVPSKQVGSISWFELKMFSGSLFFFGLGSFFFYTGRRKAKR